MSPGCAVERSACFVTLIVGWVGDTGMLPPLAAPMATRTWLVSLLPDSKAWRVRVSPSRAPALRAHREFHRAVVVGGDGEVLPDDLAVAALLLPVAVGREELVAGYRASRSASSCSLRCRSC